MAADVPDAPPSPVPAAPTGSRIPDDALLLLNRATLVAHSVRTAVHELNNVLQMIGGSAEMLAESALPPGAAVRIDAILRHTSRGHLLLQAVGDLAKRGQPVAQLTDVAAMADRVLQMRRYEQTRASIAARVERRSAAALTRIDPQQLLQVLLNLVMNAEQALADVSGAAIAIVVGVEESQVEVAVADNGPGLAAGIDATTAFVTTRAPAAAGLGLTASAVIARHWGGSLDIVNAGGTRAILRLPAAVVGS